MLSILIQWGKSETRRQEIRNENLWAIKSFDCEEGNGMANSN